MNFTVVRMILTTQAEGSSIEHEMVEQRECQPLAKKANHFGDYYVVKNTTIDSHMSNPWSNAQHPPMYNISTSLQYTFFRSGFICY